MSFCFAEQLYIMIFKSHVSQSSQLKHQILQASEHSINHCQVPGRMTFEGKGSIKSFH